MVRGFGYRILKRILPSQEYKISIFAYFLTTEGSDYILNCNIIEEQENFINCCKEYYSYLNRMKFKFIEEIFTKQIELFI